MTEQAHRAIQHGSALSGVEALTLATARAFPRHSHDGFGIGVIHAGAQRSWSGVGAVEASAGDVIAVNPGEMHDGLPIDGRPRAWRMIYLDPAAVACRLDENRPDNAEMARPALRDAALTTLFGRAFDSLTEPSADPLHAEEALVLCLAHAFGRHGNRPRPVPAAAPPVLLARQQLDEAFDRPVTLGDLAALSGVSRFQLLRGFARDTGTTPHAYLTQVRVRAARGHIAAGLSLAETALLCGFSDQSHMTRAFVRQFGVTPGRYRAARR